MLLMVAFKSAAAVGVVAAAATVVEGLFAALTVADAEVDAAVEAVDGFEVDFPMAEAVVIEGGLALAAVEFVARFVAADACELVGVTELDTVLDDCAGEELVGAGVDAFGVDEGVPCWTTVASDEPV